MPPTRYWLAKSNTTDTHQIMCVYPISGQYGRLPRLLYYALLMFTFAVRHQTWLGAGAAASALTYAGTAAIHALILAIVSKDSLLDLDTLAISIILSAGLIACGPIIRLSELVKTSGFRTVLGLWSLLAAIGAVCSYVAVLRHYPQEIECRSHDDTLLTTMAQSPSPMFNCTYGCFSTQQLLRAPSEIVVIPTSQVARPLVWLIMAFGFLIGVAVLCTIKQFLGPCLGDQRGIAGLVVPCFSLLGTVIPVEIYLFYQADLPTNEEPYAIGQWGPLVSAALVLAATIVAQWQWLRRLFGDDMPQDAGSKCEGFANKTYQDSAGTESSIQVTDDHDTASPNCVAMRTAPITFIPYNKRENALKHNSDNTADLTRIHKNSDKDPEAAIGATRSVPPARRSTQ